MATIDMSAIAQEVAVDLKNLSRELKRVLRVQWKEYIHFIEDAEPLQQRRKADNAA